MPDHVFIIDEAVCAERDESSRLLFVVQECIQVVMSWIHFGGLNGLNNFSGQLFDAIHLALKLPKPLQLCVLVRRYEVPADTSIAGDRHRRALRFFFVATKALGKFGSSNSGHGLVRNLRNTCKIRNMSPTVNPDLGPTR